MLRRTSVFAAPFTSPAATTVVGSAPLLPGQVGGSLARLADHNLLIAITVRSTPATGCSRRSGSTAPSASRRRASSTKCSAVTCAVSGDRCPPGRRRAVEAPFDRVVDDLRAGLGWAAGPPGYRADAHDLAVLLARLTYDGGQPSEAQARYEQAAALAADPGEAADALHLAVAVAWGRHAGNDAIRLYREGAEAALRAGDPRRAALELVTAAELITNAPGIMSELPPPGTEQTLLTEARVLAAGDVHVEAAMLTVTTPWDEFDPAYADLAERAAELAHRVGDTRLESHALDQLTALAAHLRRARRGGRYHRSAPPRAHAPRARDVDLAWEYSDALHMAPMVHLATGDLAAARRYAHQLSELPSSARPTTWPSNGCSRRKRSLATSSRLSRSRTSIPPRMGGGRPTTHRRNRLRPRRGGDGVRPQRCRRRPARVDRRGRRDAPCGHARSGTTDHLPADLRRDGGVAPRGGSGPR